MDGILIFDSSNDLIYQDLNEKLRIKIGQLAISQGLISEKTDVSRTPMDSNVFIQIFSPLITSQRIMLCQFDNSYTYIQCENQYNIVFQEFVGYVFLKISSRPVEWMQRSLGVAVAVIRRICGPNFGLMKDPFSIRTQMVTKFMKSWTKLYDNDQATLVEAVEQLMVSADIKASSLKSLQAASDKLKQDPYSQRTHVLLFVETKFLSLYSSRLAQNLSPSDLLFLSIFCDTIPTSPEIIQSQLLFFEGSRTSTYTGCIPCLVHAMRLFENITLIVLIEFGSLVISNELCDLFMSLHKLQGFQMQGDVDSMKVSYDALESQVKHLLDALKKVKYNCSEIEDGIKAFSNQWEQLKRRLTDLFKTNEKQLLVKIESNIPLFSDNIKELFNLIYTENKNTDHGKQRIREIQKIMTERMVGFRELLMIKAQQNLSMASYLQEFPGLVHFIHIDRIHGRMTAPIIEISDESMAELVKQKIWSMVELSRSYLDKGHMSMMWKDVAFNYTYFLWFEDTNGTCLKPKEFPKLSNSNNHKNQLQVGIFAKDYYQRLAEACFPKTSIQKIRCYELFCVHLGLVTPTCVLEHCRRLAATINDILGISAANPVDLI